MRLDPDTRVFSKDKMEHFGFSFLLAMIFSFIISPFHAFILTAIIGFTYEFGQADAVTKTEYEGKPGYGFGLLDLAWDILGAAIAYGLRIII